MGGGVAILVHKRLSHLFAGSLLSPSLVDGTTSFESVSVNLVIDEKNSLRVTCGYFPRASVTVNDMHKLVPEGNLYSLLGLDANVHHHRIYKHYENQNTSTDGSALVQWCDNTGHLIANHPECPTREDFVHRKNEDGSPLHKPTSPDVTLYRGITVENWTTRRFPELVRLSDHIPLTFQVVAGDHDATPQLDATALAQSRRPLFSWKKAKWNTFTKLLRKSTNRTALTCAGWTTMSVHKKEQFLADKIRIAQARAVPRGHHLKSTTTSRTAFMGNALSSKPFRELTAEITKLTTFIDDKNNKDETAIAGAKDKLFEACKARDQFVRVAMTNSFREKVNSLDGSDSAAWSFIRNAPRKNHALTDLQVQTNKVVREEKKDAAAPPPSQRTKANQLIRMYADISTRSEQSSKPLPRKLLENFWNTKASPARLEQLKQRSQQRRPVTLTELHAAIKLAKTGKAAGEDNIHTESLRHLPTCTRRAVVELINHSIGISKVPRRWKEQCVIPLLKPGKDAAKLESYRPVSLTSILGKVVERIVGTRLEAHLDSILTDRQSGFRRGRSTADQLAHAFAFIERARSSGKKNVAAVLVDFSRAFDKVDHRVLLDIMEKQGFPRYLTFWIHDFLRYRRGRVMVGKTKSEWKYFSCGSPQGCINSPILFLIYVNELARQLEEIGVDFGFFADDLTIFASDTTPAAVEQKLQAALNVIESWSKNHFMDIAPAKTKYIVFNHSDAPRKRNPIESSPDLNLNFGAMRLQRTSNATLLGYRFNSEGDSTAHVNYLLAEDRARLLQLAYVAGTTWGPPAQTLRTFYTGYCLGKLNYGVEAWMHLATPKQRERLEIQHRQAARIITGCVQATRITSLLNEADMPPLEDIQLIRSFKYMEQCKRLDGLRNSNAETIFDSRHPAKLLSNDVEKLSQAPNFTQHNAEKATTAPASTADGRNDATTTTAAPRGRGRPRKVTLVMPPQSQGQTNDDTAPVVAPPKTVAPPSPTLSRAPHIVPAIARPESFDTAARRVRIYPSVIAKIPSNASPDAKKAATNETIQRRFPDPLFRCWSDGSSQIALRRSGGAAFIERKKETVTDPSTGEKTVIYEPVDQLMVPAGGLACSMTSESIAMRAATKRMITIVKEYNKQHQKFIAPTKKEYKAFYRQLQKQHAVSPLRKWIRALIYSSKSAPKAIRRRADLIATQICHEPRASKWRLHFGLDADLSKLDLNNISNLPPQLYDDDTVRTFIRYRYGTEQGLFRAIPRKFRFSVVFLSDSQSLLRSLQKGPLLNRTDPILYDIWCNLRELSRMCKVSLQHVRSHCGIEGNEIADKLADEAAKLPQIGVPTQLRDIVAAAKQQLRTKRATQIATQADRSHRSHILGSDRRQKLSISQKLPRTVERQLAQLRTGKHPSVGVFHRAINPTEHPACRWCHKEIHETTAAVVRAAAAAAAARAAAENDQIGDPHKNRFKRFDVEHYCPDCYRTNPLKPQTGVFANKRSLHRHMTKPKACAKKKARTPAEIEKLCGIDKNPRGWYRKTDRDASAIQLAANQTKKNGRLSETNHLIVEPSSSDSDSDSSSCSSDSSEASVHSDDDDRNLFRLHKGKQIYIANKKQQKQQQKEQNQSPLLVETAHNNNNNSSAASSNPCNNNNNNNVSSSSSDNTSNDNNSSSNNTNSNTNSNVRNDNEENVAEVNPRCKVLLKCSHCQKEYKTKKPYEKHLLMCELGKQNCQNNNNNSPQIPPTQPSSSSTSNIQTAELEEFPAEMVRSSNNNNNNPPNTNPPLSSSSTRNSNKKIGEPGEFTAEIVRHVILDCPTLAALRTSCGIDGTRGKELWYSPMVIEFLDLALAMIGKEPLSSKAQQGIINRDAKNGIIRADLDGKAAVLDDLDNTAQPPKAEFRKAHLERGLEPPATRKVIGSSECAHLQTALIGGSFEKTSSTSSRSPSVAADPGQTVTAASSATKLETRVRGRCIEDEKDTGGN